MTEELELLGLSESQSTEFFSTFCDIDDLSLLYDSDTDEKSAQACHEKIDNKGPTITFVKAGNVCTLAFTANPSDEYPAFSCNYFMP